VILAEVPGSGFKHEASGAVRVGAPGVPGEIKKELGRALGVLDVADIDDPERARALLVSASHFRPDQCGRQGVEPDPRQWQSVVRQMVIHAQTAPPGALRSSREAADVAK